MVIRKRQKEYYWQIIYGFYGIFSKMFVGSYCIRKNLLIQGVPKESVHFGKTKTNLRHTSMTVLFVL